MAHVCPKSCGRLCTAAILIAVGVVQLIAGLILIKSKYVYLLSAPDFWTAASNFAVGGMLGVSASVWKEIGKMSPKHATRRNILASLMFSCLMINASTATILILGEGNALLSIQLEKNGLYSSSTFTSELLAYAYATSVCSPIVCIVISCVYMSGLCFRRRGRSMETMKTKQVLDENDPYAYNWVFKSKLRNSPQPNPTIQRRTLSTKYLSSDEDSFSSSDSFHPYRSNSVPSVEDLDESLQNSIKRIRTHSDSNLFHQQPDHGVQIVGTEKRSLLRSGNRVSFIDESSNGRKPSREMLLSLPQHSARHFGSRRNHSSLDNRGLDIEAIPADEYNLVARNSKCKTKEEIPFSHPNFEDIELCNESQSTRLSHREAPLKQQHYKPVSRKSIVTADVHSDARQLKKDHGYTNHSFSPEESTLVYEDGTSSRDTVGRRNYDNCHADRRVCRTSTARSLKSKAMDETTNEHRTAHRTCNAMTSNTPDEFSDMEDWNYNDSKFDQKSSGDFMIKKSPFNKVPHSSMKTQPEDPKFYASMEIVDESLEISPIDSLAGEVVPIQVSTLPRKLSSKLIPVTIPAVSSSRKYSLKAAESSDTKHFKNAPGNSRRDTSVIKTSKFDGNGEPKLLSFRGGMKSKEYRNRKPKKPVPPPNPTDEINHPELSPSHYTEYRTKDSIPPSPTHTSGYLSALEETLNSTGKSRSAENSILSSSTGQSPQKRHRPTSGKTSQDNWESSKMVKETMTRIIEESPEMHSKKELIDQLLSDPAFQKMVKQTLKETEI